jgi:hypothetical protein
MSNPTEPPISNPTDQDPREDASKSFADPNRHLVEETSGKSNG